MSSNKNKLQVVEEHPDNFQMEKAVIVGVIRAGDLQWRVEDHLDELDALADTAGAEVVEKIVQRRMRPDPGSFIGGGKVKEIADYCEKHDVKMVIFDDDLTPVQVRNLGDKLPAKVLDRSGLILDIFATRARTREAKVQVELAQMEYYYPRLTRALHHLRNSQGGIGFRGPGETQLETDRREVQRRITKLKSDLDKISKQRGTRRKKRSETPTAALIGYTNVGKSTLLNALTGKADAFVENRLFATLDSKVRRVETQDGKPILMIDTVGFIRKLPHHLVASFRSTLEEAHESDLLIHVADISHPHVEEQMAQTEKVMKDLDFTDKPTLLVFNKADLVEGDAQLERMREKHPDALFVSGAKNLRIWELIEKVKSLLYVGNERVELSIAPGQMDRLRKLPESVVIQDQIWEEGMIKMVFTGPEGVVKKALKRHGLMKGKK